jgi:hypothetical protein
MKFSRENEKMVQMACIGFPAKLASFRIKRNSKRNQCRYFAKQAGRFSHFARNSRCRMFRFFHETKQHFWQDTQLVSRNLLAITFLKSFCHKGKLAVLKIEISKKCFCTYRPALNVALQIILRKFC